MQSLPGILAAFGHALTWAITTIVLRSLSTRMDAFLINGMRAAIGLLFIVPLVLIQGVEGYARLTPTHLVYLFSSVLIGGTLGNALNLGSLRRLGVGRAFPICNSSPLFTLLFSTVVLHERVPLLTVPGAILVLAGVYLIALPRGRQVRPALPSDLTRRDVALGVIMALGAAVFWGLNAIILSIGVRDVGGVLGNSLRVPMVATVSIGIAALRGRTGELRQIDRPTLGLLVVGGILGWGLSSTLWALSLQLAGPSLAMILGSTSPLFALPLSFLFLKERPSRRTLLGTLLAVIGIALVVAL